MRRALLATGLLLAALAPPGQAAQVRQSSPQELVEEREKDYQEAKKKHEADIATLENVRSDWDQLIAQLTTARARGDDDETVRLSGLLQELTGEKTQAQFAWAASREDWIEMGESLIDALNGYLVVLDGRNSLGADDEANRLYNVHEKRLKALEEEELPPDRNEWEWVPMPEVEIQPGDSRLEIRHKQSLLENRVEEFTKVLADLDRDIERDTERQRREKRRRDREADRNRFGDNEIPTGGGRTNVTGDAGVTDSANLSLAIDPLEDRIGRMKLYREKVVEYLAGLRRRLEEEFRREGGGT